MHTHTERKLGGVSVRLGKSDFSLSLSLQVSLPSLNKTNRAEQSKSPLARKAGLIDNDDSQLSHKEASPADLFLTMYLRPKVYAEIIIGGRLPMVWHLDCLLRDGVLVYLDTEEFDCLLM